MIVEHAGERLELLVERAVWWARTGTLIVADLHVGKPATFRRAGRPVPETVTGGDLERLTDLVDRHRARRLIVLGDFFHAREGRAPATMATLAAWCRRHEGLEIRLIRGNHDAHAGDPPADWKIHCEDGPRIEPPFRMIHDPGQAGAEPTLAGHVHPVAVLRGLAGPSLRMPCYHLQGALLVLPAFGAFTGGHRVRPVRGDRVFAIGEDRVIAIEPDPKRRSTRSRISRRSLSWPDRPSRP